MVASLGEMITATEAGNAPSAGRPTKGFTYSGSSLVGANFTATLPSGWSVSSGNGDGNDGAAVGGSGEMPTGQAA